MSKSYQRRFDAEMGESDYELLLKVAGSDLSCRRVGKAVIMWIANKIADHRSYYDLDEEDEDWTNVHINGTDLAMSACNLIAGETKRLKENGNN